MKMKRYIVGGLSVLLLAGCGVGQEATKEPITIGGSFALTGGLSVFGEAEKRGMEIAIEEINAAGGVHGHPLALIAEDNQGQSAVAARSANKLVNVDNVDIVFSAFTHITQSIKSIVANAETPMIYASTVDDIAKSNKLFFRDYVDARDHADALVARVAQAGHTSVNVLTEVSEPCEVFVGQVQAQLEANNIAVQAQETYSQADKDIRTSLIKLYPRGVAEPLISCTWKHGDLLMRQLKELGLIKVQTYQWISPILPSVDTKEVRALYEESKTISTWYGAGWDPEDEKAKAFIEKYTAQYGEQPMSDALYAYDDVYAVAAAAEPCVEKGFDVDCFVEQLLQTDHRGAAGPLSFDENGVSTRDVLIIQVQDGEWVTL